MNIIRDGLSVVQEQEVSKLLDKLTDIYGDFYLTRNNLRLFIKENKELLFENLINGDIIVYSDKAIAIIIGIAEQMPRKYLKVLALDKESEQKVVSAAINQATFELYAKIKKNNPLLKTLQKHGFIWKGGRGKETLVARGVK